MRSGLHQGFTPAGSHGIAVSEQQRIKDAFQEGSERGGGLAGTMYAAG
jgi:hypothetical protein